MMYDVRLEKIAHHSPTAVIRRQVRSQDIARVVPETCGVVWSVVREQHLQGVGRHIALYVDGKITLEVGVELQAPFAGHGEVIGSELPAGPVATAVHFGRYDQLHAAHQAIREWCARHGHTLAGPSWEIYGHWVDEWNSDPTLIRTDVFYLLTANTGLPG